jgi:UDP-3-O-[3-hydroxymyristoyl] glucosamine N-acyltransferase
MAYLSEIVKFLSEKMECKLVSLNKEIEILGISKIDENNTNSAKLFWVNSKNTQRGLEMAAGVVIMSLDHAPIPTIKKSYILCKNPRRAFSLITREFFNVESIPTKFIQLKNGSLVGHGTHIESDVVIGKGCVIGYNNVIMRGTKIGNNVKIGSNNTIGGTGFGYEKNEIGEYDQIPHVGDVIIEDCVEIGNNNCIDRAALGSTIIRKNCKIDNLVHIAHGVDLGENSLIIANSMIAGSVIIGKNSWIAPSTSIINGASIGENSMSGIGAVIIKDVGEHELVVGVPAKKLKNI